MSEHIPDEAVPVQDHWHAIQCLRMRCATFLSPTTRHHLSGLWVCALTGVLAQVQPIPSISTKTSAVRNMPILPAVRADIKTTDFLTVRGARISACQTRGPGPMPQHADHAECHADVAVASWRPNAAAAPASLFQSGDAQNGAGLFRQSSIARFDSASSEAFQQCSTVDPTTGLPPQPNAPMHAALHRYNSSLEGAACVPKSGTQDA